MYKSTLRKRLLNYRKKNFKPISVKYSLLKVILKKSNYLKNKKVGAYYPINNEINCIEIIKRLKKFGLTISLPMTMKNNDMDFFEWSLNDPLRVSKLGIPEPYKTKKIYPDILFVPMVGFDQYNYRLGYGGGYYDRYIEKIKKKKKIITIGFAFSFQKVKKLPVNKHDKKMDFILTEKYIK